MSFQNRVTPFGEIVAIPQRGLFMGNRGIIHDPATRTLLRKRWSNPAWIICVCSFRDVRRQVMATQSWTELFFLDEATALAAGHRPCFYCQRPRAEAFRAAWAQGSQLAPPKAPELDRVLHRERLERGKKRIHALPCPLHALPDGAMVVANGRALLVRAGQFYPWRVEGYGPAERPDQVDGILTPPSSLRALLAGYRPVLHGGS